ncbi:solute carrier family 35 member F3 [Hetaerina americana]|uniref:solute carrier family 35 member F3 n=1 Tax=Hetaerina americana TaxID=62018 RepID=UPI003A7F565E
MRDNKEITTIFDPRRTGAPGHGGGGPSSSGHRGAGGGRPAPPSVVIVTAPPQDGPAGPTGDADVVANGPSLAAPSNNCAQVLAPPPSHHHPPPPMANPASAGGLHPPGGCNTHPGCDQQQSSQPGGQHGSQEGGGGGGRRRASALQSLRNFRKSCCSRSARKMYCGVCVTVCVTASWVGATHSIKYLYHLGPSPTGPLPEQRVGGDPLEALGGGAPSSGLDGTVSLGPSSPTGGDPSTRLLPHPGKMAPAYNAPFFTTWFCANWTILFFPIYAIGRFLASPCHSSSDLLGDTMQRFRDKGFTPARFLTRCCLFCLLWVGYNYMYVHSLRILLSTDAMALYATHACCVYLLSWVLLHHQFVGVRIVAVITCDTGIALLAYMDGITGSLTLGGVVLAACAAAGSAVYKVLFKKVMGEASMGQVALFFSIVGLLNALLLWPLLLALYLLGAETFLWNDLPWLELLLTGGLSLLANLFSNFSVAVTYDLFITLGFITAVPVSAALDVVLYGAHFAGMKLAGIVLISVGFFLVMFPDNWPDYITRLLRNVILLSHSARWSRRQRHGATVGQRRDVIDYRTGYIRSHLRSPSGRVR